MSVQHPYLSPLEAKVRLAHFSSRLWWFGDSACKVWCVVVLFSSAMFELLAGNLAKFLTYWLIVLLNAETLINEGQKVKDSEACGLGLGWARVRVGQHLDALRFSTAWASWYWITFMATRMWIFVDWLDVISMQFKHLHVGNYSVSMNPMNALFS